MNDNEIVKISITPLIPESDSEKVIAVNQIQSDRIHHIVEQVAYWRKFNALHNWIVQNCADGIDELQEIYIGLGNMEELLETMKNLIKYKTDTEKGNKMAEELFPSTEGFFFGSTEYDINYWMELEESINIFEKCYEDYKKSGYTSYYYQASW